MRRPRPHVLAALTGALLALGAVPAAADPVASAPQRLKVGLRDDGLLVRAADPGARVAGVEASFGAGEGTFASSACTTGRAPGGLRETLAIGHDFAGTAPRTVVVRVASGDCESAAGALSQPLTVTPGTGVTPAAPPTAAPRLPGLDDLLKPLEALPGVPGLFDTLGGRAAATGDCRFADAVPRGRRGMRRAETATLCLVNAERAQANLGMLRAQRGLTTAARRYARQMVSQRFFGHVSPQGKGLGARASAAQLRRLGENLAAGAGAPASPRRIVAAWMQSTPHRANILDASFSRLGVGMAPGTPSQGRRGVTYAADFGGT